MSPQVLIKYVIEGSYKNMEGVLCVFSQEVEFAGESWLGRFAKDVKGASVGGQEVVSLGGTYEREPWMVVDTALRKGFKCELASCTSNSQLVEYSV